MGGSDENNPGVMGRNHVQAGLRAAGGAKFGAAAGQNRRALSNINPNLNAVPSYHCAVNKRPLSERNANCERNHPPVPAHRPVTRRFAAQMANNKQLKTEGSMKTVNSVPVLNKSEDVQIIDAEEYRPSSDSGVPMFVHHTEAMMEEIDMMEVEMEDATEEESVTDIDASDKKDSLAVTEYLSDVYSFYKKAECTGCVSPSYMSHQHDVNERMRGILIDWLIEVHYKFELMDETLYLTINLIDRFLAIQQVVRKKLQLVGVTALLLACKYEEVSVPVVEDLILISDKAYNRKEVLDMEKLMVNTLQFNLSIPTPYVFMRRFQKAAQSDKKLELLSFFLIELSLVEYEMVKFPPSLLAAAAVFTAQCTLVGTRQWNKTSEWYTSYSQEQLLECSKLMVTFHQKAGAGKLTGVHRKYSTSKYGYAAKTEPANFLLD